MLHHRQRWRADRLADAAAYCSSKVALGNQRGWLGSRQAEFTKQEFEKLDLTYWNGKFRWRSLSRRLCLRNRIRSIPQISPCILHFAFGIFPSIVSALVGPDAWPGIATSDNQRMNVATSDFDPIAGSLIDDVGRRLAANKSVRQVLPGGGTLNVDRLLPFLCVYRRDPARRDAGTGLFVTAEGAYLYAPGEATRRIPVNRTADESTSPIRHVSGIHSTRAVKVICGDFACAHRSNRPGADIA